MPTAYLQTKQGIPAFEHVLAVYQAFRWYKYPVVFFEEEEAPYLPVSAANPIVGSVEAVTKAFATQRLPLPLPLGVPPALQYYAPKSRVMTLGEFYLDTQVPIFVKPATIAKLFDGGVIENQHNKRHILGEYPDAVPVRVAEVLDIQSEYRVFVGPGGKIVGVRHYLGDPFTPPPPRLFIEHLIKLYAPEAPCAYALDLGILASGQRIVVECNDGWALGTYGLDPVRYTELVQKRWHELVTQARNKS